MGTLAKVAVGIAVAKGVSSMTKGASGGATGGLFGSAGGNAGGGLEDMMGSILGGGSRSSKTASSGGLGGLLEELSGAGSKNISTRSSPRGQTTGGLGDLLGQLTGSGASGGLGGLIGSLAAGGAAGGLGGLLSGALAGQSAGGSFGSSLNSAFANRGEPEAAPSAEQDAMAALMLKAMIQAAKADGEIDAAEQAKLMDRLGDVSAEERAFVERELSAQVDVEGLARMIPDGLEAQSYVMSVMAIDLDSQSEAQYLHSFAQALGLDEQSVNHIHSELGVPALYA
ncbi:DUF533 domain-containing protein [Thioclava sp. A2]|uniref:DUF533 domain-containing protein n=1 Tax=Thioclava sp. FCG-A2 TaxID=3080562 RepID=UPI00295402AF|nr:DUF533 domain-containing protein [Thioclava sp. A2]MDV7271129.1 DUF533 domain-containing protein [Thioclava sp. A2]